MTNSLITFFFFFSSRRRHTRFDCDWSSDVCSSDLTAERRQVKVREHHRDLSALGGVLGGYVGCRKGIGRRCFRARVSAQGGDGVEQLAAMPDNTYAKILEVLRCQVRQDRVIDRVLAECSLILSEAKAPQPTSKVHGGALTPPGAHDPPGETTRPGHCFRTTAVGSKPVKLRTRMFFGFPPKRTSDPRINEYSPNRKGHQRRGAPCQSSSSCFLLNDHV